MDNKNYTIRERLSYWFDNKMAQSFWAKVRLLLVATLIWIVIVGFLAAVAQGGVCDNFGESLIRTFMYSLGKGGALSQDDARISVIYFILMLLTIIYCMFFTAILIGLISNALRTKVEDLGKGYSNVVEDGHTLILGFNDATFVLLRELMEANKNQRRAQTVVILGETEQKIMIEQIQKKNGWPKRGSKTRIVCRAGSIYNFDDLHRCSIETSRSVIINTTTDFEAIKAIMACSYILKNYKSGKEDRPFLVSIIQNEENLIEAKLAAKNNENDSLVILALNETLARIMVHTSRQPGLSDAFTELFNFTGSEFYIIDEDPSYPELYGKSIAEINQSLRESFAVGIKKQGEKVIIDSPKKTVFEEGDSLVLIKVDDDPLQLIVPSSQRKHDIVISEEDPESVNVLVIGAEPVLDSVLREYANYLPDGSNICVIDHSKRFSSTVSETTQEYLKRKNVNVTVKQIEITQKKQINGILSECSPDCVLIIANEDSTRPDYEDELAMRILIYLREWRDRVGKQFSITCEMLQTNNKELASATGPDDFIISSQLSALLMAQISQNRKMATLFETLLSSSGYEMYMKPAQWYLPVDEPIDLFEVSNTLANNDEIFIGVRQKKNGNYVVADIDPPKVVAGTDTPREYVFGEDDYILVLAKNSGSDSDCK